MTSIYYLVRFEPTIPRTGVFCINHSTMTLSILRPISQSWGRGFFYILGKCAFTLNKFTSTGRLIAIDMIDIDFYVNHKTILKSGTTIHIDVNHIDNIKNWLHWVTLISIGIILSMWFKLTIDPLTHIELVS